MWTFFGALFVIGYFFAVALPKWEKEQRIINFMSQDQDPRLVELHLWFHIFWYEIVPEIYAEWNRLMDNRFREGDKVRLKDTFFDNPPIGVNVENFIKNQIYEVKPSKSFPQHIILGETENPFWCFNFPNTSHYLELIEASNIQDMSQRPKIGIYHKRFLDLGKRLYHGNTPTQEATQRARVFMKEQGWRLYVGRCSLDDRGHISKDTAQATIEPGGGSAFAEMFWETCHGDIAEKKIKMPEATYHGWQLQAVNPNDFHLTRFRYSDGTTSDLWFGNGNSRTAPIMYEEDAIRVDPLLWPNAMRKQLGDFDEARNQWSHSRYRLDPLPKLPKNNEPFPKDRPKQKATR